nr:MAG TPA_asm: hypothetical protein [Caudoviricetes sp.]
MLTLDFLHYQFSFSVFSFIFKIKIQLQWFYILAHRINQTTHSR